MRKAIVIVLLICTLISACSCQVKHNVPIVKNKQPETRKSAGVEPTSVSQAESVIKADIGDKLVISCEQATGIQISIDYESIEEYMFMSEWNYALDTKKQVYSDTDSVLCGEMTAGENENYTLMVYKNVNKYISVYYKGQLVVFNLASDAETADFYKALKEKVES